MKKNHFFCIVIFLILIFPGEFIHAQDSDLKVIIAGKLIDTENDQVLVNQIIVIEKDTIRAVGQNIQIPADATVYDLSDYTVLPGLIDCHTHLTWQLASYYDDVFRKSMADDAIMAPSYARKTLEAGFTSCRDLGSLGFVDVALRNAINKGAIPGPRLQVSTATLSCTGGHGDLMIGFSPWLDSKLPVEMTGIADGADGVRKAVRYNVKNGANVIKVLASGGILDEGESVAAPRYSQEELNAIVSEAILWGRKVCAHAMGPQSIKMAIAAGVVSIEHGCILDDECIKMMKEKGIYLVSDIYVDDYILDEYKRKSYPSESLEKERKVGLVQRQSFQKAVKAGVKIAFGTDAGVYPHGWNAKQFSHMVKWGMTPMQAIKSATIDASNLMGWQNLVGSVKAGKLADIIALEKNPLDDISTLENVPFVMKGGVVFKNTMGGRIK